MFEDEKIGEKVKVKKIVIRKVDCAKVWEEAILAFDERKWKYEKG